MLAEGIAKLTRPLKRLFRRFVETLGVFAQGFPDIVDAGDGIVRLLHDLFRLTPELRPGIFNSSGNLAEIRYRTVGEIVNGIGSRLHAVGGGFGVRPHCRERTLKRVAGFLKPTKHIIGGGFELLGLAMEPVMEMLRLGNRTL